jgi:hypothetical protein
MRSRPVKRLATNRFWVVRNDEGVGVMDERLLNPVISSRIG